jgi:hypothetical protein
MEWISIKNPPKDNRPKIVVRMDDINDYCYPYEYDEAVEIAFYENGRWYLESWDEDITGKDEALVELDITHWMPLPEPPEDL